jgi:ketosteroid isomerase-like protein
VRVNRTFKDGSSLDRDTYFVFEDSFWKHRFSQEEIDTFMPGTSFEEFVKAHQGDSSKGSSQTTKNQSEKAAVEKAIRDHYAAIGAGDFERAYSYFGPTEQSVVGGRENWIAGEKASKITGSTINSLKVEKVSGNTATATVDVSFKDKTGTPRFLITWDLVKEGGSWKLDSQESGNA